MGRWVGLLGLMFLSEFFWCFLKEFRWSWGPFCGFSRFFKFFARVFLGGESVGQFLRTYFLGCSCLLAGMWCFDRQTFWVGLATELGDFCWEFYGGFSGFSGFFLGRMTDYSYI